jgi:broad specificity phosphatase PhoE
MTTVIFLRHGPTKENVEDRIQGYGQGTLLAHETEQYLAAVLPRLRAANPTHLVSSDLARAVGTRQMLKQFLQVPDISEEALPLLRERGMGSFEGYLWATVPANIRAERDKDTYDMRSYGGESDADVLQRVQQALEYLATHYPQTCVCCITHAGWLQQLARLDPSAQPLPDVWTRRNGLYEAAIKENGKLHQLKLIPLKAKLPDAHG